MDYNESDMILKIINQYSFLFASVFILIVTATYLLRAGGEQKNAIILIIGLLIGFSLVWVVVRPKSGNRADIQTIQEQIGAGRPVLLEFQSPY